MIAYIYAIIIIQVIVESFPVSSSGHVALFGIMMQRLGWGSLASLTSYGFNDGLLHLPTLFVLVIFFFSEWFNMLRKILKYKKYFFYISRFVIVADGCTTFFYFFIRGNAITLPLGLGFLITALVLFSLRWAPVNNRPVTWNSVHALLLGCLQGIALLPGISRFALTFAGARWLGYAPHNSFVLSFFIAMPLLFVGVLKGFVDTILLGYGKQLLHIDYWFIMLIAGIVAYGCLIVVGKIVDKNRVWIISIYPLLPMLIWFILKGDAW